MRLLLCATLFAAIAWAQPVVNAGGVVNAASYAIPGLPNSGIAQGSMFLVFGKGLGPASLVQVSSCPIPPALAGTSVRVTVGSQAVNALMIYTSAARPAGRRSDLRARL